MIQHSTILKTAGVFLLLAFIQGCYYDKEELLYPGSTQPVDCSAIEAKFNTDVSPIIISKCATATCHDPATASGGLILQNYSQVHDVLDRVNARVIVQKTMPPAVPLSPAEINILKCWIQSGAPNN